MLYIFLVFLTLIFIYFKNRKLPNTPPGRIGWPIIGSFPSLTIPFFDQIEMNRKKYGDIFLWRIGSRDFVFLCDPKMIREAFSNPSLMNRPSNWFSLETGIEFKNNGISVINGLMWQVHRRFTLQQLRDSGFGRSWLEDIVLFEAESLVEDIRKSFLGEVEEISPFVHVAALNVITKLSTGLRFDRGDKSSVDLLTALRGIISSSQGLINLFDLFPWLTNITPFFVMNRIGLKNKLKYIRIIMEFLKSLVDERKLRLDREHPNGLIDCYLLENEKRKNEKIYSDEVLISVLADLHIAGSDTTAITTEWILQYVASNPKVQEKIQNEIEDVIPVDRYPSMLDKPRMPYIEAVINEGLRISSLAGVGLFHSARENTTIKQFNIPKGTVIAPYFYGCHMNPKYWEKPNEFYPEHFLDENGKFNGKNEAFMPFSCGRRVCLGESLARTELFLYVTSFFQNFKITLPDSQKNTVTLSPEATIFRFPSKMKMIISDRKAK